MTDQAEQKPKSRRKIIFIIIGALAVLSIVCVIIGSCGGSTESETEPTQECSTASAAQFDRINGGLKSVQESNYIIEAFSVKSQDLENAYFVAAYIYGPGIEEGVGPGVWVISGDPDSPKLSLSVDAFAIEFTNYPDVSSTDFDISFSTHGFYEAQSCAQTNR